MTITGWFALCCAWVFVEEGFGLAEVGDAEGLGEAEVGRAVGVAEIVEEADGVDWMVGVGCDGTVGGRVPDGVPQPETTASTTATAATPAQRFTGRAYARSARPPRPRRVVANRNFHRRVVAVCAHFSRRWGDGQPGVS
jgi:hypothetical protein